jgi:hypothetical protein
LPAVVLDAMPDYEAEGAAATTFETNVPNTNTTAIDDAVARADPAAFPNNPVTSAHCVDVAGQKISLLDSVAIQPNANANKGGAASVVVHGRYGPLGEKAAAIPLEFLALLHPAAQGAAALRKLSAAAKAKGSNNGNGTIVVYGATQASGWAAAQMASAAGHAVVAVVGGEHSGNDDMVECLKGLLKEPGTAVPEEFALSKKLFQDLVTQISAGSEGIKTHVAEDYLADFKKNFYDYCEYYPDTRPAAVSPAHMTFKYMEKDREQFEDNMAAYLEQFPPGAPPIDKAKVESFFSTKQYELFRQKFWKQTSGVISGDDTPFSAPHIVKSQSEAPEDFLPEAETSSRPFPYSFSVLSQSFPAGSDFPKGGPVLGAIVAVTPTVQKAMDAVAKAKTTRAKAEALQFLSRNERAAYGAARSVAALSPNVVLIDPAVEPTKEDVAAALDAMDVRDDGTSILNYFVQVYRANDFPFYGDYAVHRASEPLAGPRQIIVTK